MARIKFIWQKVEDRSCLMAAGCILFLLGGCALYLTGLAGDWTLYGLILLGPLLHFLLMKRHRE